MSIPAALIFLVRKRNDIPFSLIFWLFGMFIISCGFTHFMGALEFFQPYYNLGAVVNVLTAIASWVTVICLLPVLPKMLKLRSPVDLEVINLALQKKNSQYTAVTNAVPHIIMTTTPNGIILEANNASKTLLGWEPTDLIGKSVEVLIPPEYLERHRAGMRHIDEGSKKLEVINLDTESLHKKGYNVAVNITIAPVPWDGETQCCAIVKDITHRKQNERIIQKLLETLKVRVASLEAFQFSVAHDLHAPLRTMEGFSEVLLEDYSPQLDADGKAHVHRIIGAVQRMRHLIQDMIRLSRVTQNTELKTRERVNISKLYEQIVEDCRLQDPGRNVSVTIQPDMYATVDAEFLCLVLINLVSNAWKFTSKNPNAKIEIGSIESIDDEVVYYVRDNGVGFDMSKVDKLFKPFSRLHDKRDFDGNGVGLTIVQQIINLHDGRVWAEGIVNQGATFYFTIGTEHVTTT